MKTTKIKAGQFFKPVAKAVENNSDLTPTPSVPVEEIEELKTKIEANSTEIARVDGRVDSVESAANVAIEEVAGSVTEATTLAQQANTKADSVTERASAIEESVSTVSGNVAANKADIDQIKINATEATTRINNISEKASGNANAIESLTGTVETNRANLQQSIDVVENKVDVLANSIDEKIDAKVAGAFKFRGEVESLDDIEDADRHPGDVWQVGDKEYAYNGTEFVELGFAMDLSSYATKNELSSLSTEVSSKAEAAQVNELAAEVDKKANKSDIPDLTDIEASIGNITSSLNNKADAVVVNNALEQKADVSTLNDAKAEIQNKLDDKVDAVPGKQLSDQNFTAEEKEKLGSLENFDSTELEEVVAGKANKLSGATENHIASVAADGSFKDSGKEFGRGVMTSISGEYSADIMASEKAVVGLVDNTVEAINISVEDKLNTLKESINELDTRITSEVADKAKTEFVTSEIEKSAEQVTEYVDTELAKKVDTDTFESAMDIKADKTSVDALEATVANLTSIVQSLQTLVAQQTAAIENLQATINQTAYSYSDPANDVEIVTPLYNQVNVVANNVAINSNITADEETPSGKNGIDITAADKVTIGE